MILRNVKWVAAKKNCWSNGFSNEGGGVLGKESKKG